MQNYLAQARFARRRNRAVVALRLRAATFRVIQALVPRNIVVRILVIALEFFIGVREVQDKLHATSGRSAVRCAIVLVINRRRQEAIHHTLRQVSTLHRTEVGHRHLHSRSDYWCTLHPGPSELLRILLLV